MPLTSSPKTIAVGFGGVDRPDSHSNWNIWVCFHGRLDNYAIGTSATAYVAVIRKMLEEAGLGIFVPLRAQNKSGFATLFATLSSPSAVTTLNSKN